MGKLGGSRTEFWEELLKEQVCTGWFPTPWTLQSISVVRDRDWVSSDRQPWKPVPGWHLLRLSGDRDHKVLKVWCPTALGDGFTLPCHAAAFQLSKISPGRNLAWDKPVGSFLTVFPTEGSCSRELTCFPHLSVHIAKPIFPRLQRWTAWCDRRCRAGGCGMFKHTHITWQYRPYLGFFLRESLLLEDFVFELLNQSISLKNVDVLFLCKKYKIHCRALQWHQWIKNKVIQEASELICLSPAKSLTFSWIQQLCS